jgi:hypothetical protein
LLVHAAAHALGIEINKDMVRRILIQNYRPAPGSDGPSWLSVIGQARDSLWSVDLFRCESILLQSYWVMVVMDIFTRRIVGFGVAAANLDGPSVCRMFNRAIARQRTPKRLSSDHDPFRFQRWLANLRIHVTGNRLPKLRMQRKAIPKRQSELLTARPRRGRFEPRPSPDVGITQFLASAWRT